MKEHNDFPRISLTVAGKEISILVTDQTVFVKAMQDDKAITIEILDGFLLCKDLKQNLDTLIIDIEYSDTETPLSTRAINSLWNFGIAYVGQLVQKEESSLLKIRNFGPKSLEEVKTVLASMGLRLCMNIQGLWHPPKTRH